MRVSAKSDYALRALLVLAQADNAEALSAEELGKRQDIPHNFLQAILADLRRAGIVLSQQSGRSRLQLETAPFPVFQRVTLLFRKMRAPSTAAYVPQPPPGTASSRVSPVDTSKARGRT